MTFFLFRSTLVSRYSQPACPELAEGLHAIPSLPNNQQPTTDNRDPRSLPSTLDTFPFRFPRPLPPVALARFSLLFL